KKNLKNLMFSLNIMKNGLKMMNMMKLKDWKK
ncbi:hypothetical protein TVAGG3_0574140, partial [Trichomonas vaginalis G3]